MVRTGRRSRDHVAWRHPEGEQVVVHRVGDGRVGHLVPGPVDPAENPPPAGTSPTRSRADSSSWTLR